MLCRKKVFERAREHRDTEKQTTQRGGARKQEGGKIEGAPKRRE